ncbi:MAG: alpha/beta hydrolase family protein [Actinobacteria bacterium]|nr:alpha/beta hydrolase family protein [Actinomycetota bacterium]
MAESPRPHSRLTARVRGNVLLDRTAFRLVAATIRKPDEATVARVAAEVAEAEALFQARGWIDDPASYHVTPPALDGLRTRTRANGNIRYTALSWPDEYVVRPEEPGASRFATYHENRIARAAVLEHRDGDRPWLVCLHGFGMGSPTMDLRAFRALHLHRDLGLNVAFLTLPLHGRRRPPGVRMAALPSFDLLDDVHGLAQAVWDARQLLAYVRTRTALPVGVMGLSLGGYVSALLASLDDVHAAVLLVPAVDLSSLMEEGGERVRHNVDPELFAKAAAVLRVVSPLALSPRVPRDRCLIVAATLDQFARPTTQAEALWRHWGEPALHWYHGGHIGFQRNKGVQPAVDAALRRFELVQSAGPGSPSATHAEMISSQATTNPETLGNPA